MPPPVLPFSQELLVKTRFFPFSFRGTRRGLQTPFFPLYFLHFIAA